MYILTNLLNGVLGIILLIAGYKIFDWLTPKWDFIKAFKNNNISGSIIISTFILGLAIVIASAAF